MTHFTELAPVQPGPDEQLRHAAAAYLARYALMVTLVGVEAGDEMIFEAQPIHGQ
jgi:hypothetical protein